jgi:hypothetical protein
VKFIGHILIQTDNHSYYAVSDGKSIDNRHSNFISPATYAHRTALRQRQERSNRPLAALAAVSS